MAGLLRAAPRLASTCSMHAAPPPCMRLLSSSPAGQLVDQMLAYTRQLGTGQEQQALDVLRSGLSMCAGDDAAAARLRLMMSEVSARLCLWGDAACEAALVGDAAAADDATRAAGAVLHTRALLAGGGDDAAASAAQRLEGAVAGNQVRSACRLLLSHALSDAEGAAAAAGQLQHARASGGKADGDTTASLALGFWQLAAGHGDASQAQFAAAAAAAAAGKADAGSGAAAQVDGGPQPLLTPAYLSELEADAHLGVAQAHCSAKRWEEGEDAAGRALAAAEAAAGEGTPLLAPALCVLAGVYSRTGRVTFAEGMLREAARLLGMDPLRHSVRVHNGGLPMHSGVVATIAWRHAQLLTALPKREGEAAQWAGWARALWEADAHGTTRAAGALGPIDERLGELTAATGRGTHGAGALISISTRRMLPIFLA